MNSVNMLNYLSMVSNKNIFVNICMHLIVIGNIASIYLLKESKFKKYINNGTILILFLSVVINAVVYGNPFHAVTFGILSVMELFVLVTSKNQINKPIKGVRTIISFSFIFIALWYPEFVKANLIEYFLVSPIGVVPCPTLIAALGILNLYYPKVSKLQFILTIFFGMIYGIIGTFKFGVYLDLSLIAIAIFSIYNILTGDKYINKINSCTNKAH